jgi:hypothetical protein
MPGKRVQFDDETWHALDLPAKDRMQDFQEAFWGSAPPSPSPQSSASLPRGDTDLEAAVILNDGSE